MRSCSFSASPAALGSMATFWTSCLPLTVTETRPPPAVPVKAWLSSSFWNWLIFSFKAWAWRIMSNISTPVGGRQSAVGSCRLWTVDCQLFLGIISFHFNNLPAEHLERGGHDGFFLLQLFHVHFGGG